MVTLYRDSISTGIVNNTETYMTGRLHASVGWLPIPLWFAMWWLGIKDYVK